MTLLDEPLLPVEKPGYFKRMLPWGAFVGPILLLGCVAVFLSIASGTVGVADFGVALLVLCALLIAGHPDHSTKQQERERLE
jgi:energy-converting hydrogenase Eha subunit A